MPDYLSTIVTGLITFRYLKYAIFMADILCMFAK